MHRQLVVSLLIVALLLGSALNAQTTFATITGTVSDGSGAVIPNATVNVTNLETNVKTAISSNDVGNYTVPQLREGTYNLRVEAPGFQPFVAQDIRLASRDNRRIDVSLQVGPTATAIEVQGGATLIETESARISNLQTANTLRTVPTNARWLHAFLHLVPGYVNAGEGNRFAGGRPNQINWGIDGTTVGDGVGQGSSIGLLTNYIESFQEVRVDMANNSAEYGAVGQVTVVSQSGSNKVHGSAFDYFHTPFFRARNPFAPTRNADVWHMYGGSISGPVYLPKVYDGRNKTFFYISWEGSIGGDRQDLLNPSVPLASWRAGDFSNLAAGRLIYDPTSRTPFPNNRIPASRINSVSVKIQERFYPLPNVGDPNVFIAQNYREMKSRPWDIPNYSVVRGDHHFSDKDQVFGRFTFGRGPNTPYEGNLPTIGRRIQRRDVRAASVSYTRTISPTMVNEFRWGMNLNNNPVQGPVRGPEIVRELGLQGLAPDLPDIGGLPKINWSMDGVERIRQIDWANPGSRNHNEEFQEHFNWFSGRHNVRMGFDLTRVEWDQGSADENLFGSLTFSRQYTGNGITGQGHAYADFLLGIPTSTQRGYAPIRSDRNRWAYDFFVSDEFRVNQKLTLTLGLRYELHRPWIENADRLSMFDITTGNVVIPDGAASKVNKLYPSSFAPIVEAKNAGLPGRTLLRTDWNNFAPRFGVAYRPFGASTVLRGGYGIYFDSTPRNLTMAAMPYILGEEPFTNPVTNPTVILPRVYPESFTSTATNLSVPAAVNPDMVLPYSMQWNVTIEHQRWTTAFKTSYIGTNTRKGDYSYDINSPVPDMRRYWEKPRLFPQHSGIRYYTNGAGHQYHALMNSAERRMTSGLLFQASWTWARDIFDVNQGDLIENPYDRARERAVSRSIPTHRVVNMYVYQLPFGKGRKWGSSASRWTNLAIGGWELSGVLTLQSGQFLTPLWNGLDPAGTAYTSSTGTPANVTGRRPNVLRDPNLPKDQRTPQRWFDVTAFAPPSPGQFGTAAKGIVYGPGINSWNMGLHKDFRFGERIPTVRWELTALNAFNRPNYGNPNMNISQGATAGVISGLIGEEYRAREFRTGLRVDW